MKCLRITTRSPSGSGPRNEMHLFGTLPTGAISYVCRVEDHKAEWLYQTKRAALKKVEYISKSEYWEECAPHIRAEHEARSAAELEGVIVTAQKRAARSVANKAREAEGEA